MTHASNISLPRRLFTVRDYHRMKEAGILTDRERVELLEGEIIPMSPIKSPHAACVDWLTEWLILHLNEKAIVRVQNPVTLSRHSEPEPDLALVKRVDHRYREQHPGPDDTLLLIEVAESSIEKARNKKLPLYARAGIPETWIVNLDENCIERYTDPSPAGYNTIKIYRAGETIRTDLITGLPVDDVTGRQL